MSLTVSVIDHRVLNDDVAAAVSVPAVRVLGRVLALGEAADVDVVEHDIGAVGHEVVVLRAVAEDEVRDDAVLEAVDADQHGPQRVDVLGVQVIPDLPVAVESSTYRKSASDLNSRSTFSVIEWPSSQDRKGDAGD